MKVFSVLTSLTLASSIAFSFDISGFASDALKTAAQPSSSTKTTSNLSDSTVSSGLKEALKVGVDFGVKTLSKKDGYLNNADVKIPLPDKLAKAESLIRKVGGDKVADDLINSMNDAATEAAPKTASIFMKAIEKMTMQDAKTILAGDDHAATEYFQKNTTTSLQEMIKPIVVKSMQQNSVAKYYDKFNGLYASNIKSVTPNSSMMSMAKSFGADEYLPSDKDAKLDDYVTSKAIEGLFKMIATKEAQIRKDPVAQTTSLLKTVFGN
jgi:hypothetical protein